MRVAVVDDLARARFLVVSVAEELGHEVVAQAPDGAKGVEEVARHSPDVVVMDFSMPVMDGLEATRLISQDHPGVSVIAYTSTDDPDVQEQFLAAGACDHVEKGDLDGLTAALRSCGGDPDGKSVTAAGPPSA
jgi:two-component system, chemotaxis family, chemotaxis protein CheY